MLDRPTPTAEELAGEIAGRWIAAFDAALAPAPRTKQAD